MSPKIACITEVRFYKPGHIPIDAKQLRESERDLFYELFWDTKRHNGFSDYFTEKWWNEFGPDDGRTAAARVEIR